MRLAFADSNYWIAIWHPNDQWHQAARTASESLGECILVTTDEVLIESANLLARQASLRRHVAPLIRKILSNPNVKVVPQTRSAFLEGFDRLEKRADKGYSLTDCISMLVMEKEGICEVLTHDHHFEQEGFSVLMK